MLVRLLYVSKSSTPQANSAAAVDAILSGSRQNNPGAGITGVLIYSDGLFLQAIEGGRAAVSALYNRISKDTRHTHVMLLSFEEITERRFGNWTMGQVNLAKINTNVVLKYSDTAELNPYAMSGAVSLALLEELMNSAAVMGRA